MYILHKISDNLVKTGLPDLIVVILADNRPVAARVQKLQISKEKGGQPQE
jgi:hypothetical protein